MKKLNLMKKILGCLLMIGALNLSAQQPRLNDSELAARLEADKRIDNYLQLVKMGYTDREIYEDLGNANFLSEKYETAAFWYQKLIDLAGRDAVPASYQERYQYALHKAGIVNNAEVVAQRDWFSKIKQDYQIERSSFAVELTRSLAENYDMPDFGRSGPDAATEGLDALRAHSEADLAQLQSGKAARQFAYTPPVAVTADGRTAYFSKAVEVKPLYGLFSKNQVVHKIFRAERIDGEWKKIREVDVAPKYASAMHPAISSDGTRLYFSSDMPGSYGKYDIYVAEVSRDGSLGQARNMGEKVNSRKDELYPSLVGGDILFFASDGRDGYGGLDLYAARVSKRNVGLAVNIGSPFNSRGDEFALNLQGEKGMAHVMSNRGAPRRDVQELVFSYYDEERTSLADNRHDFMEIISVQPETSYTQTMFDD